MKRSFRTPLRALAVLAVAGVMLTACGRGGSDTSTSGGGSSSAPTPVSVVFASSAVDANIANLVQGMKDSIPDLEKANNATITLEVMDAGMSADKQITQIQNAITKKPSVIVVDPVDLGPITAVVQQAKAAGIKTYALRPSPNDPPGLWDGATDQGAIEKNMTVNMQAWMQGQLDANASLVWKVGLIYGAAAQTGQLIREDVVKDMAKSEPDKVQVVAEKFGDWSLQIAQDATTNFLTAHPEMNLVVTANNQMAQGAVNAITSANKGAATQVATYDVDVATVKAVGAGKIAFATGFELYGYGKGVMVQAVNLGLGKPAGPFDVPLFKVTKENAAQVETELHP